MLMKYMMKRGFFKFLDEIKNDSNLGINKVILLSFLPLFLVTTLQLTPVYRPLNIAFYLVIITVNLINIWLCYRGNNRYLSLLITYILLTVLVSSLPSILVEMGKLYPTFEYFIENHIVVYGINKIAPFVIGVFTFPIVIFLENKYNFLFSKRFEGKKLSFTLIYIAIMWFMWPVISRLQGRNIYMNSIALLYISSLYFVFSPFAISCLIYVKYIYTYILRNHE